MYDYYDESPPDSPDDSSYYNDAQVEQRIRTLHQNVCSDQLDQVTDGLNDLKRFATYYYDDGKNQDSVYYEQLLIPDLMLRLRHLFFEPIVNKQVTSVMQALIPENWRKVVDQAFGAKLSEMIANQVAVNPILGSAAHLVRMFIVYGDEDLKLDLLNSGLICHMSTLSVNLVKKGVLTADEKEFVIHTLWSAGELLPTACRFNPDAGISLYQVLNFLFQVPDDSVLSELVSVMSVLSVAADGPQLLHRHNLTASLMRMMMQPEYHSHAEQNYAASTFLKGMHIIHNVVQSDGDSRAVVLQDIRNTWTMESFFSFLIKDHQNREPSEVEFAILVLRFLPLPELMALDLIPSVVFFVHQSIHSQAQSSAHPRPHLISILQFLFTLIDATGLPALKVMESGILSVVEAAMSHFKQSVETISLSLRFVDRLLTYPDEEVRKQQAVIVLSSRSLQLQIEELALRQVCTDLCHKIQCTQRWYLSPGQSGDIMHMMTNMRLG